MTDFREAFQAGQDAAARSERSRKEIDEVFAVLNRQLGEMCEGKIEISRQQYEKKPNNPFLVTSFMGEPREMFWAISARNPKAVDKAYRQIAQWEQNRGGYPCKISWTGIDNNCHDKDSLEACLAKLLTDATVGERLKALLALPLPVRKA